MRVKRDRVRRGVYILPSLMTLGNLACGFFAIVSVYNDEYLLAAWAILGALVFDWLDGAIARVTGGSGDFGIELDSLADVVSFGVAPALLAYVFALKSYGWKGGLVPFAFAACGMLRLARFNVQTRQIDRRYFVGLPIPAAAAVIASFVLFMRDSSAFTLFEREVVSKEVTSAGVLVLVGLLSFLMVSRLRYRSLKEIDIKRRRPFPILVSVLLGLLIIASQPHLLLFAFSAGYAASGLARYLPRLSPRAGAEAPGAAGPRPREGPGPASGGETR